MNKHGAKIELFDNIRNTFKKKPPDDAGAEKKESDKGKNKENKNKEKK
jgi:hypothetical protein